MMNVKNKKITVFGAARSGIAAARLLQKKGANVFVSDLAPQKEKEQAAAALSELKIDFEFGAHSARVFEADWAVLSPGIPLYAAVIQKFLAGGKKIYSEIETASWFCKAPLIAVTGSNGKTTTTTLIGEMLKKTFPQAIVAGNIGQPFADYVLDSDAHSPAVVEVSSFQLETIDRFHPRQAVVLNFAPNHLDRYKSYEHYLRAKWRITKNLQTDDQLIFNGADEELVKWCASVPAQKAAFDINGDPQAAARFDGQSLFLLSDKLIDVADMKLRGRHNYMNAMAAAIAANSAGVPLAEIGEVLADFAGVEHRLEFVAAKEGVKYINDSKATTVESLSFALQSFKEPIILIAGGKDKGSDFTRLNDLIKKHTKAVVLIGAATEKMHAAWQGLSPLYKASSLAGALQKAKDLSLSGDVVLLSPACASFDMFSDFEDRGRQFKELVKNL